MNENSKWNKNSPEYKEYQREYNKAYRERNKEKLKEKRKAYCERLGDIHLERKKVSYHKNKHKPENIAHQKAYSKTNSQKIVEKNRRWVKKNKEHCKQYMREYHKERRKSDAGFKMLSTLRYLHTAIKKNCHSKYSYLLGCSIQECREHIEKQFTEGMTWENHAPQGWHIDHIIPCKSFDLTNIEQQKQCFHYSNLQPLWWRDNLNKRNM